MMTLQKVETCDYHFLTYTNIVTLVSHAMKYALVIERYAKSKVVLYCLLSDVCVVELIFLHNYATYVILFMQ